jgi:23S rRNA pseudouridine1911/1915/1917 synthase
MTWYYNRTEMKIELNNTIPEILNGLRLDQALAQLFPQYSRAQHQTWIRNGHATVNNLSCRPRDKVKTDDVVHIIAALVIETHVIPQDIPLDILYEDEALIVINKPSGIVVHPGSGNYEGTIVNALLHYDTNLDKLPRAGMIHRLDKDTSGVLIIARRHDTYHTLVQALQAREIKREYQAITQGVLISGGRIEAAIGRHPRQRTHMAVVASGKPAVTHYRIMKKFKAHTLLQIQLETGRTHQIRVHFKHIGYPLIGDKTYLTQLRFPKGTSETVKVAIKNFPRQALHAAKIELTHPISGELLSVTAPLPDDLSALIQLLEDDSRHDLA